MDNQLDMRCNVQKWGFWRNDIMGFEDIKVDGLSVEKLREETDKYNLIFFGQGLITDKTDKGQLGEYLDAKSKYLEKEFDEVKKYFLSLKWDYSSSYDKHKFRASDSIYFLYQYENDDCYIEFKNEEVKKYNILKLPTPIRCAEP
jgi:hypothetical protein